MIKEQNLNLTMVENCGMENETIYHSAGGDPDEEKLLFIVYCKKRKNSRRGGDRNDRICRSRTGSGRSDHSAGQQYLKEADIIILCRVTGKSGLLQVKKKPVSI